MSANIPPHRARASRMTEIMQATVPGRGTSPAPSPSARSTRHSTTSSNATAASPTSSASPDQRRFGTQVTTQAATAGCLAGAFATWSRYTFFPSVMIMSSSRSTMVSTCVAARTAHRLWPADLWCPRRAHLRVSVSAGSPARPARATDTCATSGRSTQRSRAGTSTWRHAVPLHASLSHPARKLTWRGAVVVTRGLVTSSRKTASETMLPRPFYLVAGAGFEPATSGL